MDWLESHLCRAVLDMQVQEILGRYHCRCSGMQGGNEYMLISAAGIHSVRAQHLGLDETSAGLGGPSSLSTAAGHSRACESCAFIL